MVSSASARPAALAGAEIAVVSVPVADQERALRFYVDKVGFEVIVDAPWEAMRWVQLGVPGGRCSIALVTWFERMPPGGVQGLVLETPDVQRDYAALSARGVEFSGPPAADFYGTHAEFADPDGNGWTVLQPPARG